MMNLFRKFFLQRDNANHFQLMVAELSSEEERHKLFLIYLNRGWLILGIATLILIPFFSNLRLIFAYLAALIFPTFFLTHLLSRSGKRHLAGMVFTLAVNFGLYGSFLIYVYQIGADRAFETQSIIWLLMGLAILFAGVFVEKWASLALAALNTLLLIVTQLVLAPNSSLHPSILMFWWILAFTVWMYERTLHQTLDQLLKELNDRRSTEQALRDSEERNRVVAEMAADYIFIVDVNSTGELNLRWASENMARLTGRTADEITTLDLWKTVIHPNDVQIFLDFIENTLTSGQASSLECRSFSKSGEQRWIQVNAKPRLNDQGQVEIIVGAVKDISARKRAEEEIRLLNIDLEERVRERTAQLEASNRELEAFSYSVSHDLRAPLRAMNGFSRVLLDDYADQLSQDGIDLLHRVRANAERMGRLIDDLLKFSHLSRQELNRETIQPAAIVNQAMETLSAELDDRQVDIIIGDLPQCQGDPSLLTQVWINLLSNAFKYTRHREQACVEIGCITDENDQAIYFVRDNGVGFDLNNAERLFTVFQRYHLMSDYEGTGVGLAISHRIITRHNGRIWAESKPDQGATFYFTLGE